MPSAVAGNVCLVAAAEETPNASGGDGFRRSPAGYLGEFGRHDHLVQRGERLRVVRLVGSHDPYLQLRDRDVLVPDTPRQKDLWRTLGRPGAVLIDGDVVATWRPRASGRTLTIQVDAWTPLKRRARSALSEQAERLAAHRGLTLDAVLGA